MSTWDTSNNIDYMTYMYINIKQVRNYVNTFITFMAIS